MDKTSVFTDLLKDLGYLGENTPVNGGIKTFTSLEEELSAITTGAAVRDLSANTHLLLSGNDALDFLHRISTNAVKELAVNRTVRTTFTNEKGRILDSVLLLRLQDTLQIIGSVGTEELLHYWLNKFIIMDDVKVVTADKQQFAFEITGPQAEALTILLFGDVAKRADLNRIYTGVCESHAVHFTPQLEKNGKKKFIVLGSVAAGREVLRQCKYSSAIIEIKFIGTQAWDLYRIEAGIPDRTELNEQFNPLEAKITDEINFKKGCYIGQEVIARLDTYGKTQKELCGFTIGEQIAPAGMLKVYTETGEEAGVITSTAWSAARGATLALGYLRKQYLPEETELHIENGSTNIPVFRRNFLHT